MWPLSRSSLDCIATKSTIQVAKGSGRPPAPLAPSLGPPGWPSWALRQHSEDSLGGRATKRPYKRLAPQHLGASNRGQDPAEPWVIRGLCRLLGPAGMHYRPCGPVRPYGYSVDPMTLCAPWTIKCLAGHLLKDPPAHSLKVPGGIHGRAGPLKGQLEVL